jgi:acetylornithine deacetylase/succinyl-diaminopimelate desuccinylase-like protein
MSNEPRPNEAEHQSLVRALCAEIEREAAGILQLTQQLIAADTANPPGNERRAALIVQEHLIQAGFVDIELAEPLPGRANLICRYKTGRPGPTLLLNGHLDTKPPGHRQRWHTDPYQGTEIDGRLYGLGAVDMKGADAALVYALIVVRTLAHASLNGEVILVLSADEEGEALHGARFLVQEKGLRADAVLIAEPCGILEPWDSLPLISRGFCGLQFTVRGTQTHSSISDRLPVANASLIAADLLLFLKEHLKPTYNPTPLCPTGPTVNLGATIHGGAGLAIVSGEVTFTADIRTLPGMTQEQMAVDVESVLAAFRRTRGAVNVAWSFVEGNLAWTEPTEIAPDLPLVQSVRRACTEVLGHQPPLGYFPGGTDAIWWQGYAGIPTIPAFGPGLLSNAHQPNEYVDTARLLEAAKIFALTILDFLQ